MDYCLACNRRIYDRRAGYELDCEHIFHIACLLTYFRNHRYKCLYCRHQLSLIDRNYFEEILMRRIRVMRDESEESGYYSD